MTNYTGIDYFGSTDKPDIFLFPFSFESKGLGCLEKQLIHYHLSETHDYFFFQAKGPANTTSGATAVVGGTIITNVNTSSDIVANMVITKTHASNVLMSTTAHPLARYHS